MNLVAKNGIITIIDDTNNKIYSGIYKKISNNPKGADYKIVIEDKTGHATVAMTTYANGTKEPTLPINLDNKYSMYFYACDSTS